MKTTRAYFTILTSIAALGFVVPHALGRSLCNQENMTKYTAWCLDTNQQLSAFQNEGVADVVKGRYCGKPDLVRDGLFRCLGHDTDALKTILGCSADDNLSFATALLGADDPRKAVDCSGK
jgi:hypothetical protein